MGIGLRGALTNQGVRTWGRLQQCCCEVVKRRSGKSSRPSLEQNVEMESGANGIVFNGQDVRGKFRGRRQNVTNALEVLPPGAEDRHRYRALTMWKDALDVGTDRRDLRSRPDYRGQRQTATRRCICRIINDLVAYARKVGRENPCGGLHPHKWVVLYHKT